MIDFQRNSERAFNDFCMVACRSGDIVAVNRALENVEFSKNLPQQDNAALCIAAEFGHLSIVNRFLEFEDVRKKAAVANNRALRWAAQNGHLPVVNRLLEFEEVREKAIAMDNEALRLSVINGHHALAVRLLQIPSVSTYVKLLQQDFVLIHQEFFKELENQRFSKVLAVKVLLSENIPWPIVTHILGLSYHDLCGKLECMKVKEGNAEGLISCPILNQFRRKAFGAIERVQANRAAAPSASTNSTAGTETTRARIDRS